jgi:signal transduction histidine kinase/CheY-like chemotaxis protein
MAKREWPRQIVIARVFRSKTKKWLSIGLMLGFWLVSSNIRAEGLLLNPTIDYVKLLPYMEVLEDPRQEYRLAEVYSRPASDWKPLSKAALNKGFTSSALWFKIRLDHFENQSQKWYLQLHNAQIEQAQIALISEGHYVLNQPFGNYLPFDSRGFKSNQFVIPLDLNPLSSSVLILKLAASKGGVRFAPDLTRAETFIESQDYQTLFLGACFGTLLLLMLLNFSLYFGTQDRTYLSYSVFVGLFGLWQFQQQGYAYMYLWPSFPEWEGFSATILMIFTLLTALEFSSRFLEIKRRLPKILTYFSSLAGCIIVIAIASWLLPARMAYQITLILFIPTTLLILYSAFISISTFPPSRMFFIAWSCLAVSTFVFLGVENGIILPTALTQNAMIIGALSQAFLLSLAVASRISHLRYSKNLAKEEIVRARASAKVKGDLLAVMSHEIRTPLNGVLGLVQLIEDTELNSEQTQYVRSMKESGKALLEVINSVLDFATIDSGKLNIEFIDCHLQDLLDDTVSLFSQVARERKVEFYALCKSNVPTAIKGDPIRIRQILINLLGNAFKFTNSGEIRITVEIIKRHEELLLFKVRDTGIGIRPEVQEILFESFSDATQTLTRHFGGTGLSLNICKKLVTLMSGHIGVISEQRKGSTFWFTLPLHHSTAQESHWLMGQQVYILGDGEHVEERAILGGYFEQWGAQIMHLGDLERLANQNSAEIIVLFGQSAISQQLWLQTKHFDPKPTLICIPDYHQEQEVSPGEIIIVQKPFTARRIRTAIEHGKSQELLSYQTKTLIKEARALRILIAEDNPVNRMILIGLLERVGLHCDIAENGKEAIKQFQLHHYDVILLDCEMPEMDGYETALRVRLLEQMEERPHSHIIAVSAHAFDEHIQRCRLSGMDEHIAKPIIKERLYHLLQKIAIDRQELSNQPKKHSINSPPPAQQA